MASNWIIPTVILCSYGFFKDMKPSEPFLTPYLNSTYKHFDPKDLSDQVYPVSTYAYFVFLFLVFMFTDILRYKPLIIMESIAYLSTRVILIWGNSILIMQIMQVTYGLAMATEIAYYSYIYAMVDASHYRKVTSYTRTATLLGKGTADVLGQILISTHATNYLVLNYISFGSVLIAFIISLFLPKVHRNVIALDAGGYEEFQNEHVQENDDLASPINNTDNIVKRFYTQWKTALKLMFISFKCSYSKKELLMWSIWWAFAMCGGLQIEDYVMNLWLDITGSDSNKVYNGAVFACGTLLSAFIVFLFSLFKIEWGMVAEILIGIVSLVDTVLLLFMAYTTNIWVAYVGYVVFRASYAFVLTVASYQIALHVEMKGYALVFGWNTFIALAMQSLLTFIVTDKNGLDYGERKQFVIYGVYFGVIGVVFIARPIYVLLRHLCVRQAQTETDENDQVM